MNDSYVVEIESLELEGRGVARRNGKVVFVEGALPGEQVLAVPLRVKASHETARAQKILRASAQRVTPRCPHFGLHPGACGGCSMQHLDLKSQVAVKQRALEDTLWHIGRLRPEVVLRPIEGPGWFYRFRARLSVRHVARKGGVLVGFRERSSSYVADMSTCMVVPQRLGEMLPSLRELLGRLSVRDRAPQIEVAADADRGGLRLVLVLRVLQPPTAEDCERLLAFGRTFGVQWWLQPGGPDSAQPLEQPMRPLRLALPEHRVDLPFLPTDFTQVNPAMNEVLVRRALMLLDPREDEQVADLFCGLGNFSLPLARRARRVVGIEGAGSLLERARAAALHNGLDAKVRFEQRDLFAWNAEDWRQLQARHGQVQAVLVDPPRDGALAVSRVLAAASVRPRRVVYVSCNPSTLARDCAVLVHEGAWRLRAVGVFNMFPHTSHVESIALLEPG